ncbi:MAG TPA: glycoside hydrolase family 9 protein [Polyangiaceae bacterium]|nr:glycoside hydrolase family 9 protein [Polyangiaceae bacterium]
MSWRILFPLGLLFTACDSAESSLCPEGQIIENGDCTFPTKLQQIVRVSTVGFVPGSAKQATYAGFASTYVIRSADDDSIVFPAEPGPVKPAINASDSGEGETHTVDFSDFDVPGEYYIEVQNVGLSNTFRIGDDVFVEPFQAAMLGMYGWRCGSAVSFEWQGLTFGHGACHLDDGPGSGGWHDAGDYGKYTNNGAFALGMMLFAWDHYRSKLEGITLPIPEQDNGIPDYLDECLYQANWLLGMQLESGGASDRITSTNFDGFVMPESSSAPRNMAPVSTKATGDMVAALAHMARIVREFDEEQADRYEAAAKAGWQFLLDNDTIPPPKSGYTGSYGLGNNPDPDTDDRAWAAAELWETTGDPDVLAAFEEYGKNLRVSGDFDWADVSNLGIYAYLGSEREGRSDAVRNLLQASLVLTTSNLVEAAGKHAYGRSLGFQYNWGINGSIARTTMALMLGSRLDPANARADIDTASLQLDHLFGRNYYGRSFTTGVGLNSPQNPHYRPSVADTVLSPWPGMLVGGSFAQNSMMMTPGTMTPGAKPPADQWVDDSGNFQTNEVAINWNAPLIYALAAFLPD